MIKNRESLKAKVANLSKESNIPNKYIIQSFMFEALLKRISISIYKEKFIIKGGLLLASIFGVNLRSTMDMDTQIKGISLNIENIEKIITEIINIDINDNINMTLVAIKNIRQEDIYSGYNVNILAEFDGLKTNLLLDITTGDPITYSEITYDYITLFDNETINIMTYNFETIIAEKFETIVSRNVDNTRMKDYYDLYMFTNIKWNEVNQVTLKQAIENTAKRRDSMNIMNKTNEYISLIEESDILKNLWKKYQNNYNYAKDITFEDTIKAIKKIGNVWQI